MLKCLKNIYSVSGEQSKMFTFHFKSGRRWSHKITYFGKFGFNLLFTSRYFLNFAKKSGRSKVKSVLRRTAWSMKSSSVCSNSTPQNTGSLTPRRFIANRRRFLTCGQRTRGTTNEKSFSIGAARGPPRPSWNRGRGNRGWEDMTHIKHIYIHVSQGDVPKDSRVSYCRLQLKWISYSTVYRGVSSQ